MRFTVVFGPGAEADLQEIYLYLLAKAGRDTATRYIEAIIDYCQDFETFPERGMRFDEISPGLRVVGYMRKATIAFRVKGDTVTVLRIFNGGRNVELNAGDEL